MSAFMEQRHLGRTGLRVSRIGLGTLTWDAAEESLADGLARAGQLGAQAGRLRGGLGAGGRLPRRAPGAN
ncbi:hypothetical protein SVIOM342S_01780 [Streptomyces violaceorubidus]